MLFSEPRSRPGERTKMEISVDPQNYIGTPGINRGEPLVYSVRWVTDIGGSMPEAATNVPLNRGEVEDPGGGEIGLRVPL